MDPLVLEFEVKASQEHAFTTWTERCAMWWPGSHRMSQTDEFEVIFEPFVGGRIFEVDDDGGRHEWGRVTVWEPPGRLAYTWHIFLDPDHATTVEITFTPSGLGTMVRLVNRGFEVFGDGAAERKGRVGGAWQAITDQYRSAVSQESNGG